MTSKELHKPTLESVELVEMPSHDDFYWFKAVVRIKDSVTGEIRDREINEILYKKRSCGWSEGYNDKEWSDYIWSEGNNSCDCNRMLDFYRAHGEEPEEKNVECGYERYSVNLYTSNGDLIYQEFDE